LRLVSPPPSSRQLPTPILPAYETGSCFCAAQITKGVPLKNQKILPGIPSLRVYLFVEPNFNPSYFSLDNPFKKNLNETNGMKVSMELKKEKKKIEMKYRGMTEKCSDCSEEKHKWKKE
jgi:hypothetical protein